MALFDQNDAGGISASSRWLRSVSDDTTGRRRDIRSCTPTGVPAAFFRPHDRWCRFAQPPATRFDASGIILLRDVSFLTATCIYHQKKVIGKVALDLGNLKKIKESRPRVSGYSWMLRRAVPALFFFVA